MATPESAALATQTQTQTHAQVEKHWYSVWAVPPEDVRARLKKLMDGLRAEFGGPQYEPHMTVVKAVSLRPDDALDKFRSACQGLKPYIATVDHVATGFCVYLQIHPTAEAVETSAHCKSHFGVKSSTPYMPHLSILYGDMTDEEMKKLKKKLLSLMKALAV